MQNPAAYCIGDTATPLSATGENLLWYDNNGNIIGATAPTPATTTAGNTSYFVSQTVNDCESPQAEIVVQITDCGCQDPAFIDEITISDNEVCEGTTLTLSATISGGANSGTWTVNPADAGSFGDDTALNTIFTPSSTGNFVISFTTNDPDGAGTDCTAVMQNLNLTVHPIPLAPAVQNPAAYCIGDTATPLSATGENLLWYDNNGNLIGATAPTPATTTAGNTS
ncbi:MAG: hypothetical protein GY761_20270, partial [Hyphomicrobiales bacterium]|nr:hypothetical protein [Hyphomicrobiales bacterium]